MDIMITESVSFTITNDHGFDIIDIYFIKQQKNEWYNGLYIKLNWIFISMEQNDYFMDH